MDKLDFLNQLNTDLTHLEKKLSKNIDSTEKFSNLFILGLPRSGTTLIGQILFNCLNVNCVDELSSKFWKVPLVGAHLSKYVLGDFKSNNYESFYGRALNFANPHEFSWFWHEYLEKDETHKLYNSITNDNLHKLSKKINQLSNIYQQSLVYKPLDLFFPVLENLENFNKKSFFIYIDRNELDIGMSILKARQINNKNINDWWSSYPLENDYIKIKNMDPFTQIAGQIFFLKRHFFKLLDNIPEDRLIIISYEKLCSDPYNTLNSIITKINKINENKLSIINKPKEFVKRKHNYNENDLKKMESKLKLIKKEYND
ncbi:hypothetical protein CRV02_00650 [Arcobacter sp. CECT 8989]|uniref:sulfotransferase n=1 Tax=Arcobacter sp. CECT 8989 TaxID=2044509 RepID=UPI00100BEBC5|nr:sulfotransferase [Arcobacter sp. CECT 8989]RXK03735.1 hypothetical protein CRV02_00650 [Arcobacter sp. CECT 8989]